MFEPGGPTFRELARQALSSTDEGYDQLAPRFDRTPFRTPEDLLMEVEAFLGDVEGDGIDLCCGTGAGTAMLRRVMSGRVVGLDFSQGMLDVARRAVPGAEWVQQDVRALDMEGAFDLAVSFGAFGHIRRPEQDAFLERVHRCLRPGGRFVFVTSTVPGWSNRTALVYRAFNAVMKVRNRLVQPKFVMYYLNFLLPEVESRLERAGFRVVVHPVEGGPYDRAFIVEAFR